MRQKYFGLQLLIALSGCCLLPIFTAAQGWQRFVGDSGEQRAFSVRVTPEGGLMALGSTSDTVTGQTDWYFFRADSLGTVTATNRWGTLDSSEYGLSFMAIDSQIMVLGNVSYPYVGPSGLNQRGAILWDKIDAQGNVLSQRINNEFISVAASSIPFQNGHLVVGANYTPISIDSYFPQPYWLFIDSSGTPAWSKTTVTSQYGNAVAVVSINDHAAIVAAKELNDSGGYGLTLYKIGDLGGITSQKSLEYPGSISATTLFHTGLLIGDIGQIAADLDLFVVRFDTLSLDTLWTKRILLPGTQMTHAALLLDNGNMAVVGEHIPVGATSRDAFLAMIDPTGNLLWFKTYGGLKGDIFWDIQASPDENGFIIAGQTASFGSGGDLQAWLLRTDSVGQVWSNRVVGRVVRDAVQNCVVDTVEVGLGHWIVTASGADGAVYTFSDSSGAYSMALDTGAWFVSTLPPSGYWMPCEDSIGVVFNQMGDTLTVDFPTQALYECPLLDVDISTPFLRRCFDNTFFVRYFNYGTSSAPDAVVRVVLDPYLSVTGSDLSYVQSGDTLIFSIGAVPWLKGGSFGFTAFLDCDSTILGQVHCTEAHIYPDSLCYSFNPVWDGSHLEVGGYCAGDSVVLTVTNTGAGMQGPVGFIITEDQIIFRLSTLKLEEGQDTTFVLYPNGASVAIVVTQTPGHPGNSQPMLVLEGCGAGIFSTGYGFQFPQNDGDPSTDIECKPNIGSFDPNDKTGLPLGVADQGIISQGTKIEYLIRFQNTGTDTAFRVEIRDTLSKALDIGSLKEGASSHPYRLEINGSGVLSFIFDPILLPDSTSNWIGSQGFVKYSIYPKTGVVSGTKIENSASIYFDHNPPVQTKTTLHTIDNLVPYLFTKTTEPNGSDKALLKLLQVTPNPTKGHILVKLQRPSESGRLHVALFNAIGVEQRPSILWESPTTNPLEIDCSTMPAGIYFIMVTNELGSTLGGERIIKY